MKTQFITLLIAVLAGLLPLHAQQMSISGIVTDKKLNDPIIGASVVIKGTSNGCITDLDGNFQLSNVAAGSTLVVSYIGYQTLEIPVQKGKTSYQVALSEDTQTLDEVVVVGFGTQKKVNLTGAVASVDNKKLESRPVTSVGQALQGVVPGLNVSIPDAGGKLDANPSFNIRGTGNLGTGSSASPLVLIDGVAGDLNQLNPQDIDNISVLMDAASAAIYGSRAPFGVILVTTKKGKQGKTSISYSNNLRWSRPTNIPDMLDAYTFAQYFNRAIDNTGSGEAHFFSDITMERIQQYMRGEITTTADPSLSQNGNCFAFNQNSNDNQNWPRNFIDKTAFGQEHNVSLSGGNERIQYYVSGAFLSQDGQMNYANDNKKRYNASARISAEITKWMRLEFNSRFIREDIGMPTFLKLYGDRFFSETTKLHPNMPLYDNNGHYTRNPKLMQLTSGGRSNTQDDTYFTQGSLILTPMKGLTIHGDLALRTGSYEHLYNVARVYLYDKDNNPIPEQWLGGDADLAAGKTWAYSEQQRETMITTSLYADYSLNFLEKHNLKVMLGMNSESYRYNNVWAKRSDVMNDNNPDVNTSTGTQSNGAYRGEWSSLGYFGRLNYDFDGRYLFEFNIRRDGSSRFRADSRWATFPSVSVGWNIARESFWEPLSKWFNTLKPRFSYGSLGNQNTNSYYPTYAIQAVTVGSPDAGGRWLLDAANKSNIASAPGLVSSLLTWERVYSYNYGVDFGAFNNRLSGYFNYFIRDTKDMVGPAQEISPIVGASAPQRNNTSLRTKGWELQLNWQDRIGEFNYNVAFNLSDSRTKITEYPNASKSLSTYYTGQYLGEIWGYESVGMAKTDEEMAAHLEKVDQNTIPGVSLAASGWKAGDMMYADLDGDGKITNGENTVDNPGDRKIIGNSTPRFRFGLNIGAEWKGIDLSIFFQGVAKRDYLLSGMIFWGVDGNAWSSTGYKEHWDFFRPEGDPLGANTNAYYPRPLWNSNQNRQSQSQFVQNASYIRLKNLQIGYTLPKAWVHKIGLERVRVFFSGDNLWTGTSINKNFDPEALYQNGMTYPLSRTLSCGVNVTL
ncbi:MAG TPA: TonB-dependent receptor [Bacteroides mediterraneensis]|uniref:SusC/RagA family TonB-linked outer membrane protein n=1 Tax=Bacteroides mediterraneensis TaxID=1841856 RepID=UPI0026E98EFD|nr:TonB-dependent receptor [Bacteroides mediterraneensis]HJH64165.1 TonB-dependent receptor [Bacteroides mediterraneensis]